MAYLSGKSRGCSASMNVPLKRCSTRDAREQWLRQSEEIMKTKWVVLGITLVFALAMVAQTASQSAPAGPAVGDKASACPCCGHDMANMKPGDKCPMMKDGKMAKGASCCGKDGGCCKDGKCDMKAMKDGKMACCADGKCPMMSKDGKAGCCGDECPMMKKGEKTAAAKSCCAEGAACCAGGGSCCGHNKAAA